MKFLRGFLALVILFLFLMIAIVFAGEDVRIDEVLKKPEVYPEQPPGFIVIGGKQEIRQIVNRHGGIVKKEYHVISAFYVDNLPQAAIEALESRGFRVERNKYYQLHDINADIQIGADLVWAQGITGEGVKVAVIDTGVQEDHPDLYPDVVACFNNGCKDTIGHGTHVAGIITASGVNDYNAKGVAPDALIYSAKACTRAGCPTSDILAGIDWAISQNVDVISMSIGGVNYVSTCDGTALAQGVNNAVYTYGIPFAVSAGNENAGISDPACASGAIAVGAVDINDNRASWSNYGHELDIMAPGVDIYSTYKGSSYATKSGTSMSCPHVAGVIALLKQDKPALTVDEIKSVLYRTAVDLGTPGWDHYYGWGRLNASWAIEQTLVIKTMRVYDVTGLDTHTDTSNLIRSGLSQIFSLEAGKTYRAEIEVKNIDDVSWSIPSVNAFHESLNSSWEVDAMNDIWYTIDTTDYTGGTWSNGNVTWDTSLGGAVGSNQIVTFKYVFDVPSDQGKNFFDVHAYFSSGSIYDEDYSTYTFKLPVCFVLYNKGSPNPTYEQPYIDELKNIGYPVEYDTANCNYTGSNIKDKTADFTGYSFWTHSYLYANSVNYFANAKTYYVDQLGNNELILGYDAAFLGDFGYATANTATATWVDGGDDVYVRNVDSVLPSFDYAVGNTVVITRSTNGCDSSPYCEVVMDRAHLISEVVDYANAGTSTHDNYIIHGIYSSTGRMGFFGIGPQVILNELTTYADAEDNGKEILTYLTDWLTVVPPVKLISITLIGYPVDFGNFDPGTNNNPAPGNVGDQYIIRVDPETNVDVDLYQKGDDYVYDTYTLGIGNMTWSLSNDVLTEIPITKDYDSVKSNVPSNTDTNIYYWIDIPSAHRAGDYTTTIYVKAVETGSSP